MCCISSTGCTHIPLGFEQQHQHQPSRPKTERTCLVLAGPQGTLPAGAGRGCAECQLAATNHRHGGAGWEGRQGMGGAARASSCRAAAGTAGWERWPGGIGRLAAPLSRRQPGRGSCHQGREGGGGQPPADAGGGRGAAPTGALPACMLQQGPLQPASGAMQFLSAAISKTCA